MSIFEIMQVSKYWYELIKSEQKILIKAQVKKLLHPIPKNN